MSDGTEVDKILSKAKSLEKAFGRTRGALILFFALCEEVITEEGRSVRQTLKIKPSESLFSKLSKLINVKVDISTKNIKDIFRH
jgi:hypothetical protein